MKNKIYKLLSVLLTLAIVMSTCVCAIWTTSAADETDASTTVYPTMAQGTIDGGTVMSNVMTRIHTAQLLPLADYDNVELASGYQAVYHFYDVNGTWVSKTAGWDTTSKTIQTLINSSANEKAFYFRVVVSPTAADTNITPDAFPQGSLALTKHDKTTPILMQGNVLSDGTVQKGNKERCYSAPLLPIADYERIAVSGVYQTIIYVYDKDGNNLGRNSTAYQDNVSFTAAQLAAIAEGAVYFRMAIKNTSVSEFTPESVPADAIVFTLPIIDSGEIVNNTYYVTEGATGGNGSQDKPFSTIEEVIVAANAAGCDADDVVKVNINGTVSWTTLTTTETLSKHTFKLVLNSSDGSGDGVKSNANVLIGGPIEVGANVTIDKNNKALMFDGNDLVFSGVNKSGGDFMISMVGDSATYSKDINAVFNIGMADIWVPQKASNTTFNGEINLVFNGARPDEARVRVAGENGKTVTYNKPFNLIYNAKVPKLIITGGNNGKFTFAKGAGLQVINNAAGVTYSAADIGAETPGNVQTARVDLTGVLWILNGADSKIATTATAGTFTHNQEGKTAVATDADGNAIKSVNKQLVLPAGVYTITFEDTDDTVATPDEPGTGLYDEYINNRGNGLKNTFAKLNKGEKINVLYMGGSATVGTGIAVADRDTKSWRGLVSTWLTENAGTGSVNNVNVAYGDTCTLFGAYRLGAEILPQKPDLIFVELSLNDLYNSTKRGYGTDGSKMQFESIIRGIRNELPECDIVTVLITDKDNLDPTKLHNYAQVHEEMSATYNIPTIHVGRALAQEIVDTGKSWTDYAGTDGRHPGEAGYAVYGNVIKEYLAAQKTANGTATDVTNHTLPNQVSSTLIDPNKITFIDADNALIAASQNLNGSGFVYGDGATDMASSTTTVFRGGVSANLTDDIDDKLFVEFTGSEILIVESRDELQGFNIKIDDATDYEFVKRDDVKPLLLKSGLEDTSHKIEIVPVLKDNADTTQALRSHIQGFFVVSENASTEEPEEPGEPEEPEEPVIPEGYVSPVWAQGNILNDKQGEIQTDNLERIYTKDLLSLTEYESATVAEGYRVFYYLYDADGNWLRAYQANWVEGPKTTNMADLAAALPNAAYFRAVGSANPNANPFTVADMPADAYLLKKAPAHDPDVDDNAIYYISTANGSDEKDGLSRETAVATFAKAIELANATYGEGKTVSFVLIDGETVLYPKEKSHKFNLVITSEDNTGLKIEDKTVLAGNTTFDKVGITASTYLAFGGHNVKFTENASIIGHQFFVAGNWGGADATFEGQNIEISGTIGSFKIFLSSHNANATYGGEVELIVDGPNANPIIYLNKTDGKTTTYNKNVNINVKQANTASFGNVGEEYSQFTVGGDSVLGENAQVQIINSMGKDFADTGIFGEWTSGRDQIYYNKVWVITNNTGDKDAIDFTEFAGLYNVKDGYNVTAVNVNDTNETKDSANGQLDLREFASNVEIINPEVYEYFEDFENITNDELLKEWNNNNLEYKDSSVSENGNYELIDGKLNILGTNYSMDKNTIFENKVVNSLDQYISLDFKGSEIVKDTRTGDTMLHHGSGIAIYGRFDNAANKAYEFKVTENRAILTKISGQKGLQLEGEEYNDRLFVRADDDEWDTSNIKSTKHYTRFPNSTEEGNLINFNEKHTYRMGMSIVDSPDGTKAYVRIILTDLTTNTLIVDDAFVDTKPYTGTTFGFNVHGLATGTDTTRLGANATFDNIYFSNKKFREGDLAEYKDINLDGIYDVRDLVRTNEYRNNIEGKFYFNAANKVLDDDIYPSDESVIRKELLREVPANEFTLYGQKDNEAAALREEILNVNSGLEYPYYYPNLSDKSVRYEVYSVYYVSSDADGSGTGKGTADKPLTLEQFNELVRAGSVKGESATKMAAVLFKRGSEFNLDTTELLKDDSLGKGQTFDYHAYINAASHTVFGTYGEGEKPIFNGTAKNYADVSWTNVAGTNIYWISAPEFSKDFGSDKIRDDSAANVLFDDGASVGTRRFFAGADFDYYTLYKNGHFAYDRTNNRLYLYCEGGKPGEVYDKIEVSRSIYGATIDASATNVVFDNLNFTMFGLGGLRGLWNPSKVTISNSEFSYCGGVIKKDSTKDDYGCRFGNAIEMWNASSDFKVTHSWIYQTFDSAISPQANTVVDITNFTVEDCLLEHNNTDIEMFVGDGSNKGGTFKNANINNNMFRFTSFGWGTRESDKHRGIEGVLRADFRFAGSVSMNFKNNIVDTPGKQVFNIKNKLNTGSLFKFNTSTISGNEYYYNYFVRNYKYLVTEYLLNATDTNSSTYKTADTRDEFVSALKRVDESSSSKYSWFNSTLEN